MFERFESEWSFVPIARPVWAKPDRLHLFPGDLDEEMSWWKVTDPRPELPQDEIGQQRYVRI